MNLSDYQLKALQSIAITEKSLAALSHRTLGLSGEAGIIADAMKKAIRDNHGELSPKDIELLKEKLGDTLYYVAALAEFAGLELEDIAEDNLKKSEAFRKTRSGQSK